MSARSPRDAGIALLLAVWLLAVLAALAAEFLVSTRVKYAAERNQRDAIAAHALAQAGYRAALAAVGAGAARMRVDDEGRLVVYRSGDAEGQVAEAREVPLGDGGVYSWRLEAEDGRFDVNEPRSRENLRVLLAAAGLEPGAERDTIIDSILDWTDANREHRLNGAEEDWYRAQDPPYSSKDAPFDVPEELLLVRGVKPVHFHGGAEEEGGKTYVGLRDLVTVCPTPGETGRLPFTPALAPKALLEAYGLTRAAAPVPIGPERYFRVVASGRSGTGPERTVAAVVLRTAGAGGSAEYALVYWLDNHAPVAAGEGELR